MDKLIDYVCEELDKLEKKVEREGSLSMAEIQYIDTLAHTKKNLMKAEEMRGGSSYMDRPYRGSSYARGRRRGANQYGSYAMDGYSRNEDMVEELRDLMNEAPDEKTRREFEHFIRKIEQM